MSLVETRTSGKIILSGEHAVVYGAPALAATIALYTTVKTTKVDFPGVIFEIKNYNQRYSSSWAELRLTHQRLLEHYQHYKNGTIAITDVIKTPEEFISFILVEFIEAQGVTVADGLKMELESAIPVGGGLGSSASVIIGMLQNLGRFFQAPLEKQQLIQLAQKIENLRHAKSSGLDIHTILNGGWSYFQDGVCDARDYKAMKCYVIDTGVPESTTGESVAHVAQSECFDDPARLAEFASVTCQLETALREKNDAGLKQAILANQRLLEAIGVVPQKIQQFIVTLEAQDVAAKISGAGAIKGDAVGHVIAFSDRDISDIVNDCGYRYSIMQLGQAV